MADLLINKQKSMQYELFYLVGASKEAELDRLKKEAAEIVTSEGGVFAEKQVVEKRKLAYEVKHEKYGFFVAQRFELDDTEKMSAINKRLNLHPEILRFLISRAQDLPELTSRQERETQAQVAKAARREAFEIAEKKTAPVAGPAAAKPENTARPGKETKEVEDIDKQLEEILNI